MPKRLHLAACVFALAIGLPTGTAYAQSECDLLVADPASTLDALLQAGCTLTSDQISAAMDNPVGEMISVPVVHDWTTITEPIFGTTHTIQNTKLIPTFPVRVGDDWSLVNRFVFSFPTVPINESVLADYQFDPNGLSLTVDPADIRLSDFSGSTTGFGDVTYVGLFTPNQPFVAGNGKVVAAFGPTFTFPTASHRIMGQGKYQAGLAGALAYIDDQWTLGVFPQHRWSFAGDSDRRDVNRSNIQYFVQRKLPGRWTVGSSPTVTVDWNAAGGPSVDFPVGIGVNKTAFISGVPFRFSAEIHKHLTTSGGLEPDWTFRLSVAGAVPAAFVRNFVSNL